MANDRGKKKPTPKRRPTPKVAGRTSLPPEVRGAKATSHEGPADERLEASTTDAPESTTETAETTTETAESTTETAETTTETAETTTETAETTTDTPESTDPADTSTVSIAKPKTKPVARVSTLRRGDASAAGSDTSGTPNRPMGRRPGRRDRRGSGASRGPLGIRTGVLAAIAAGLFVVAAILAFHPGAEIGPNKAFVDQESTAQLTSQAQERICAVFGYDHTELDKWQQRAQDALTGQARTEFDETLKAQRDLITQTKTGAECRVDAIGVRDLSGGGDGATATVIANLIVSETQNSMATNSGAPRAQFAMVREGDQWRIRAVEPF
ncbi:hypothetical protein M1C59_05735 [Gordonia terrae]|uniref:hypothetical protein n=1 Tax=Gordonia terrae TaxID=2055 RepID=UPI00200A516E|nr:hypothetical protein [Gordonia terrae]UPW10347.1 hypothetical protein M1C59_05735 [Gordonia terrae]